MSLRRSLASPLIRAIITASGDGVDPDYLGLSNLGMNQDELKEVKIKQLALDIIQERVFTSRHIPNESDEEWLCQMERVFTAEAIGETCRRLIEQKEFTRVLYYEYKHFNLNPDPNDLPIFRGVEVISGGDLVLLEQTLADLRRGIH